MVLVSFYEQFPKIACEGLYADTRATHPVNDFRAMEKRKIARTSGCCWHVVFTVAICWDVSPYWDPTGQLSLEDVAFVKEEDQLYLYGMARHGGSSVPTSDYIAKRQAIKGWVEIYLAKEPRFADGGP